MIKAITFDFWDTIYVGSFHYDERVEYLLGALAELGFHRERGRIEEAFQRSSEWLQEAWLKEQRAFAPRERVEAILENLGIHLGPYEILPIVKRIEEIPLELPLELIDGAADCIWSLRRNFKLGLISDTGMTPGRVLREFLRRDGILECFSHLTFSDEIGVTKPHQKAFLTTLAHLGVRPEEAVHIGDRPDTDIRGAKSVGMRAILFRRGETFDRRRAGNLLHSGGEEDVAVGGYNQLKEAISSLGGLIRE
ncbi:MAG: HAD family hydrolase [bacterium]